MKKSTKVCLIIATCLVLVGSVVFCSAMSMLNWDFSKMNNFETNTTKINEKIVNISIESSGADILIVPTKIDDSKVVCYEKSRQKHSVTVSDGNLEIKANDTRKWYEYIGINFGSPKITIYLPKGEYDSLSVKSVTGDVEIPREYDFKSIDISQSTGDITNYASANKAKLETTTGNIYVNKTIFDTLDVTVTTGTVSLTDVTCNGDIDVNVTTGKTSISNVECKNFKSEGTTGDVDFKKTITTGKFTVNRSTGDITFDGCDGAEIFAEATTGDICGTLLTEKVFIASTSTGSIEVPKTVSGGRCELTTSTGDIEINIIK